MRAVRCARRSPWLRANERPGEAGHLSPSLLTLRIQQRTERRKQLQVPGSPGRPVAVPVSFATFKPAGRPATLRLPELTRNQVCQEFRDPRPPRSAVVDHASARSNVLDFDSVRRRRRVRRALAASSLDVQRKVVGSEPETDNLGGEGELIASRDQVMMKIATQDRLSLFAETQMHRVTDLRGLLLLLPHDPFPHLNFGRAENEPKIARFGP